MNRHIQVLTVLGALSALLPLFPQRPSPKHYTPSREQSQAENRQEQSRGQRIFNQNCARCHDAPQSFRPQISGTVVRHMRVRASLSAADEKALIEFLNP